MDDDIVYRPAWREVSVAGHCLHAAVDALERADDLATENAGWSRANAVCAVTMLAFALEAAVNHLLQRAYDHVNPYDASYPALDDAYWMSTRERIELYFRVVEANEPDFGVRPFQVVGVLKSVRDSIAHGKPFIQERPIEIPFVNGQAARLPRQMGPAWEAECTIEQAKRHRDDLLEVYRAMLEAGGDRLGNPLQMMAVLNVDMSPSSARLPNQGIQRAAEALE